MGFSAVMTLALTSSSMAGVRDVYWYPTELTNTLVWLDASDTNTLWADTNGTVPATAGVARWDDKSGNGNHQLQATASAQPMTGSRNINGVNALDFDGADDTMQEASNAFGSVISNTTAFVVSWFDDSVGTILALDANFSFGFRYSNRLVTSVNGSINWNDWVEWYYPYATNLVGRASLLVPTYSVRENEYKNYVDGELSTFKSSPSPVKSANGTVATTSGIKFGLFNGVLGEAVIINGTVTTEERQLIEGYLAWKWEFVSQLPLDHPYKDAAPNYRPGTVVRLE